MATLTQPIGISLPVMRGSNGYFNQTYDVSEQIKTNIHSLLKTKKGERRMNPDFGSGLVDLLFSMNDEFLPMTIESTVKRDIERWMPYISVQSVSVNNDTDEKNKNQVSISILYIVNNIGLTTPQNLDIYISLQ